MLNSARIIKIKNNIKTNLNPLSKNAHLFWKKKEKHAAKALISGRETQ